MGSRAEITTKFAKAYAKASKKDKGRLLGEVVAVTGWSRDNARRRLTAAAKRPVPAGLRERRDAYERRHPVRGRFLARSHVPRTRLVRSGSALE